MTEPDPRDAAADEEFVPEDDAIIGTAFKWSLLVIALLAAVVVTAVLMRDDSAEDEVIVDKDVGEIEDLTSDESVLPRVRFTDCTADAGIDFVHTNGAAGAKLLPETMGGGVAFFDYDSDGDPDLLFVNSTLWPDAPADAERPTSRLYRNDGGSFVDVTAAAGLTTSFYGMGAAVGDVDGDGDPDLYLTAVGTNRLYRNDEGRFVDITSEAGVAGSAEEWSASAGFFDADNDGDLDLFVGNYVRWSAEIDEQLDFRLDGTIRAYGPPTNYTGTDPYLFRNDGGGKFVDISAEAGIQIRNRSTGVPVAKSLGVTFLDVDGDNLQDIIVANDTVQNFLFHNQGDCKFEEVGVQSGLAFDGRGEATGAMGIDLAHFRNDEAIGVCIANFAGEMSSLFVSQREPMLFSDDAVVEGIGSPSRQRLSFGLYFFDYDLDGRLDLLQSNGHLEERINEVQPSQNYLQPAQLFWNAGPEERSCFSEVPSETVGDLARPIAGRGSAYGDIDGDGDLDVVLTQVGRAPLLLRNDQQTGHHWLRVVVRGTTANRSAIGAWVELTAGGQLQRRRVMPSRSYLSQSELALTFGLGSATAVDSLEVVWPGGERQVVPAPASVDTTLEIVQEG